jgi:hypothetical protein
VLEREHLEDAERRDREHRALDGRPEGRRVLVARHVEHADVQAEVGEPPPEVRVARQQLAAADRVLLRRPHPRAHTHGREREPDPGHGVESQAPRL